jgi:hypothetical protein
MWILLQENRLKESHPVVFWVIHLFDPPPLASLTLRQKIARILGVSLTLLAICLLLTMLLAAGILLTEHGH